MISNKEVFEDFKDEYHELHKRIRYEKQKELDERTKNRFSLNLQNLVRQRMLSIETKRGLTMQQLKSEKALERREKKNIDTLKLRIIQSIRGQLVANVRRDKMKKAIALGMQRRNNIKMIKIIKLSTVMQTLRRNYIRTQEIQIARINGKIASIKIYLYFRKLMRRKGPFIRLQTNDIRNRMTLMAGSTCVAKAFKKQA